LLANVYFGSFNVLIPFASGAGIMLLVWISIKDLYGYIAFVVIYGICANAVQTLFPSALASLTTDLTKMGVRIGMVFTIVSLACLTGPPIAGALISYGDGSYRCAQIFGGTSVLAGALILMTARWLQGRNGQIS
jgi:MFS family permease